MGRNGSSEYRYNLENFGGSYFDYSDEGLTLAIATLALLSDGVSEAKEQNPTPHISSIKKRKDDSVLFTVRFPDDGLSPNLTHRTLSVEPAYSAGKQTMALIRNNDVYEAVLPAKDAEAFIANPELFSLTVEEPRSVIEKVTSLGSSLTSDRKLKLAVTMPPGLQGKKTIDVNFVTKDGLKQLPTYRDIITLDGSNNRTHLIELVTEGTSPLSYVSEVQVTLTDEDGESVPYSIAFTQDELLSSVVKVSFHQHEKGKAQSENLVLVTSDAALDTNQFGHLYKPKKARSAKDSSQFLPKLDVEILQSAEAHTVTSGYDHILLTNEYIESISKEGAATKVVGVLYRSAEGVTSPSYKVDEAGIWLETDFVSEDQTMYLVCISQDNESKHPYYVIPLVVKAVQERRSERKDEQRIVRVVDGYTVLLTLHEGQLNVEMPSLENTKNPLLFFPPYLQLNSADNNPQAFVELNKKGDAPGLSGTKKIYEPLASLIIGNPASWNIELKKEISKFNFAQYPTSFVRVDDQPHLALDLQTLNVSQTALREGKFSVKLIVGFKNAKEAAPIELTGIISTELRHTENRALLPITDEQLALLKSHAGEFELSLVVTHEADATNPIVRDVSSPALLRRRRNFELLSEQSLHEAYPYAAYSVKEPQSFFEIDNASERQRVSLVNGGVPRNIVISPDSTQFALSYEQLGAAAAAKSVGKSLDDIVGVLWKEDAADETKPSNCIATETGIECSFPNGKLPKSIVLLFRGEEANTEFGMHGLRIEVTQKKPEVVEDTEKKAALAAIIAPLLKYPDLFAVLETNTETNTSKSVLGDLIVARGIVEVALRTGRITSDSIEEMAKAFDEKKPDHVFFIKLLPFIKEEIIAAFHALSLKGAPLEPLEVPTFERFLQLNTRAKVTRVTDTKGKPALLVDLEVLHLPSTTRFQAKASWMSEKGKRIERFLTLSPAELLSNNNHTQFTIPLSELWGAVLAQDIHLEISSLKDGQPFAKTSIDVSDVAFELPNPQQAEMLSETETMRARPQIPEVVQLMDGNHLYMHGPLKLVSKKAAVEKTLLEKTFYEELDLPALSVVDSPITVESPVFVGHDQKSVFIPYELLRSRKTSLSEKDVVAALHSDPYLTTEVGIAFKKDGVQVNGEPGRFPKDVVLLVRANYEKGKPGELQRIHIPFRNEVTLESINALTPQQLQAAGVLYNSGLFGIENRAVKAENMKLSLLLTNLEKAQELLQHESPDRLTYGKVATDKVIAAVKVFVKLGVHRTLADLARSCTLMVAENSFDKNRDLELVQTKVVDVDNKAYRRVQFPTPSNPGNEAQDARMIVTYHTLNRKGQPVTYTQLFVGEKVPHFGEMISIDLPIAQRELFGAMSNPFLQVVVEYIQDPEEGLFVATYEHERTDSDTFSVVTQPQVKIHKVDPDERAAKHSREQHIIDEATFTAHDLGLPGKIESVDFVKGAENTSVSVLLPERLTNNVQIQGLAEGASVFCIRCKVRDRIEEYCFEAIVRDISNLPERERSKAHLIKLTPIVKPTGMAG